MKIIRDKNGNIINIGDWDFIPIRDGENIIFTNPLPEGSYEDESNVITGWDGGFYAEGDPRAIKL